MSTTVTKGVLTAPVATGQQTYTLPAGTDPKALVLAATYETADAVTNGHAIFSIGFGTYDGGAVQQLYLAGIMEDGGATSNTAPGWNTTAILKGFSNAVPTVDYEARLVSMSSTSFVLDWIDAPASAIKVHYWVLGGSDVTGARVGDFGLATFSVTQDVTVNTGFGQPDLLLFLSTGQTSAGDSAGSFAVMLSAAISGDEKALGAVRAADDSATMAVFSRHPAPMITALDTNTNNVFGVLAPRADWPVDGFRITYDFMSTEAVRYGYLALRGTFEKAIGTALAPFAAAPQTQNFPLSEGVAKGAMFWGGGVSATGTIPPAWEDVDTDVGGFWLGFTDGTNEGMCGCVEDGGATDAHTGRFFSSAKAAAHYVAAAGGGAPTLASEADASLSNQSAILTWNDTDTRNRDFSYLVIGEPLPDKQARLTASKYRLRPVPRQRSLA